MSRPSPANRRAFVRRATRLQPVPDIPGVRLHLADDVAVVSGLTAAELGQPDPGLPFWAFAWAGGLGIARYLAEHPDEVAGRRVLDVASGSGLCAIVAARAGASSVQAVDIDPLSGAAVALNARLNRVRVGFTGGDPLSAPPPSCDVILAGDVCYEQTMSSRMIEWLRVAATRGTRVLIGDPGRTYLPPGLQRLATYRVHTTRELEDAALKETSVFTIPAAGRRVPADPVDEPLPSPSREASLSGSTFRLEAGHGAGGGPMAVVTRRRSVLSGVFGILLVATVGAPAVAAPVTRWVDDDGRAGSAGCDATKAAPRRIQAAIDASGPFDTIVVCPGVYRGELNVAGNRQNLTIRAAVPGTARVRARAVASAGLPLMGITGVAAVTVRGLVFQAPTLAPCRRVPTLLSVLDAPGTVVRKSRFEPLGNDTLGPCGYEAGIVVKGASNLFADRVVVRDFRARGIDSVTPVSEQGPGIHVQDSQILFLHATESPKPLIGAEAVGLRALRAGTTIFWGNEVRSLQTARTSTPLLGAAIVVYDVDGPTVNENTVRYVTWGVTVFASVGGINDNDIRFGRKSGQDSSVGIRLSGGDQLGVRRNGVHRFGWGIHVDGGAQDHLIRDNDFRDNNILDCWDETSGLGTAGTDNTWTSNLGFTDSPDGICSPT